MAWTMQPTEAIKGSSHMATPMDDPLHSHAFEAPEIPTSPRAHRAYVRRSRSLKLPTNYTMYASKQYAPRHDSRRQAASASNSPQGSPIDRSFDNADFSDAMVSSTASTAFTQLTRSSNSTGLTTSSNNDDFTLPTHIPSPRWDSIGYKQSYSSADYVPSSPYEAQDPSFAWETRDEFPTMATQPSSRIVSVESVPIENFSRPRNASIKQQQWVDPLRKRSPTTAQPEFTQADALHAATRFRDRGQSNSSSQSIATYSSLPPRTTSDYYQRESSRGRPPRMNPHASRQPAVFSRAESSEPAFGRNPLPHMASMPSEELRSSYRSQLTASTAPGTLATETERSSVLTKYSSVVSIYDDVDEDFSVDDVMGMYEKGFDDSGVEDNDMHDSRPTTSRTEQVNSASTFQGIDDILPQPPRIGGAAEEDPIVRDSAAFFAPAAEIESKPQQPEVARSQPQAVPADDSEDDDFPLRPAARQQTNATETRDEGRDRYGFRKQNQYITQQQYDSWDSGYSEYLARRRKKWNVLLKENGLMTDNPNRFPPRSAKMKRFVRKGVPPEWRGAAWFYYAGGPAIVAQHAGLYDALRKQTAKPVDVEGIERDLHRTFPDNIKFRSNQAAQSSAQENSANGPPGADEETPMISSLRRVLLAFAIYNPRIGYCQSLNFLAGLLLLFVGSEEQAFWLLNIITRVYLPGTHEVSLEGANVDLAVLMSQIRETMPAVWNKIGSELDGTEAARPSKSRRGRKGGDLSTRLPPITLCMTPWFMSCFIGTLPIESTLRVWDVFFYEGSKTLFRIALTIFKTSEPEIRAVKDPMEIFQTVQTIPRRLLDANVLMEACFKRRNGFGHISQESVEQKRADRRILVKLEKEKLARGDDNEFDAGESKRKPTIFNRRKL
ncbi:rab-GTPase-TBC domain-containing protein [Microdochium bolleyi]|uniref:Rab-GTPase-TBC domain-containing protein n=1 Tax=Microdochium bolleyi TaxID=196109 RepID=A0A136J3C3_9PEZI|nr:rab-GTPase-TBC domain-containing protein [Microdochium bolleyi]